MTQGPYHLYSISLLLIMAYLLSLFAARIRLFPVAGHRRFWNVLLLLFFASTAILGILLAFQVNYKLEWKWTETALQWHVDLGIGFAMVSIFHLTWHIRYYTKMISRPESPAPEDREPYLQLKPGKIIWLFLLLGFISILAQLLLLREFIRTLHGNELVIGIFLAIWMVLTSSGAWAGATYSRKLAPALLMKMFLYLSVLPLIIYLILLLVDRFLFLPGFEPGMIASIAYITLLLALFGLVNGFLFSYLARSVRWNRSRSSFYTLDSLGSLTGGILFSGLLVYLLDNLQVVLLLPLITALVLAWRFRFPGKRRSRVLLLATSVLLAATGMFPGPRYALEKLHFRDESVLYTGDTPYGSLTFTSRDGQVNAYLDRNPVLSSSDVAKAEETVHYAALQHPDPGSFLLIGGILSGNAAEVLKYGPQVFDGCEAVPDLYTRGRGYLPDGPGDAMQFRRMDGRRWLATDDRVSYDVIIVSTGDPVTLGWNRYYTREFYSLVHDHLNEGGIFTIQLNAGGNYINDPGGELIGINYHSLQQVFDHVEVIPGYATYFIASDRPLTLEIPALAEARGIETTYVNGDYLDAMQLQFDSDQLLDRIRQEPQKTNSDLWPRLFFVGLMSLQSRMGGDVLVITGIVGMLLFLILPFFYTPLRTGMYVSGFSGAGIQMVLILVMQSFYGYAYMVTPVMITLFLGGIVVGNHFWNRIWRGNSVIHFTGLLWVMALLAAILVVVLKLVPLADHRGAGQWVIGCFNFLPGLIVGSVYGMSLEIIKDKSAADPGLFFSADLTGAALGTFIPGLFMIPLLGVANTIILFCGINAITGLYVMTRWR